MTDRDAITRALQTVPDVGGQGDIVGAQRVRDIEIEGGVVRIVLSLPPIEDVEKDRIEDGCFDAVSVLDGVDDVTVVTSAASSQPDDVPGPPPTGNPFEEQAEIEGVKNIIAVASGKGGVGKSTVAVNLALALGKRGVRVGLLDADVYGPSVQILLGVTDRPSASTVKEVRPVEKHGIKLMSLGFLTDANTPVIWRGPIVMSVIKKFLQDVEWGNLDYLIVDLPPGTGDAQLTLAQTVPITGAVIVTTPSELALVDAQKGLRMFEEVGVPVIGIIENMSTFVCPHCGEKTDIFDTGGGKKIKDRTSVDILVEIPLDPKVRAGGDSGVPIVESDEKSAVAEAFFSVADKIVERFPAHRE